MRSARPNLRRVPCRAACSRSSRPVCRWPVIPGSSRSAPRCAAKPCRPVGRPPPGPLRGHSRARRDHRWNGRREAVWSVARGRSLKMAVKATQRGPWRTLLLRGLDTAAELSDLVAQKISAAADPRARLLRRRRRALRWGLIFSAGCLFWAVVTALLAAWGWFALLLEITGPSRSSWRFRRRCCYFATVGCARSRCRRRRPPTCVGCRRPVRQRDPRCTRWAPRNADSRRW